VDGGGITWRSLLALGVSGGLIPCPSALVLLLGAIALGRIGFGLLLVVSFSLGLAVVLTAIGLLMVYARRIFDRFSFEARVPRLLPVAGALAMMLAGLGIVLEALRQARVL
jgi:ABC-type nickel/cobalt efflux system permease component RcnA